ncbi:response regulator transcription factor [Luteimonas fraxinea]|uniref:Response regulator transcription factor n=1 Tax=Luteimonas fraxinea TaxID=2901869 RepID=A0ABS8U9Z1_9GAMM|nr:response regulator transcription factor [Luteimonas fraxinea]MCD9095395.1 response regulator transcription factor [Luteimonas fraxinea]MCD9126365.1 response regulator transcription factor [Luteimonas fraxinea]UHH11395.1 response regulator transcription factor [Luteimonas fraxinea]
MFLSSLSLDGADPIHIGFYTTVCPKMSIPHRRTTVLLVDDDARLAALTTDWLEKKGIAVDYAASGSDALNLATEQRFDAILLDIDMPGMCGITVCRRLRDTSNASTPIVMLTARDSIETKVAGLEAGADDYVVKPFWPDELIARIEALTRRTRKEVAPEAVELDGVRVDPWCGEVTRDGKLVRVLPTGMAILLALMRAHPRALTRQELLVEIWGAHLPESDSLRSHIYQLRKHLNAGFDEPLIETLPGAGMRFRAPRAGEGIRGA